MPVSPEIKAAWEQVKRTALNGSAEAAARLKCGTCGGPLDIVFTGGRRTALNIRCIACHAAVALDGEFEAPPWVGSLGGRITTSEA